MLRVSIRGLPEAKVVCFCPIGQGSSIEGLTAICHLVTTLLSLVWPENYLPQQRTGSLRWK